MGYLVYNSITQLIHIETNCPAAIVSMRIKLNSVFIVLTERAVVLVLWSPGSIFSPVEVVVVGRGRGLKLVGVVVVLKST